jgi:ACS family allantoate permease-like MFS transporter
VDLASMADEKQAKQVLEKPSDNPFAKLDARFLSNSALHGAGAITNLQDADEALGFLENHPRPAEIAAEGNAILEDPVQLKKLIRKIDWTIAPLLASVYFLQFLDKTTLAYTAVMGIRTDTHLVGQDYSDVSMLFYIGKSRGAITVST